MKHLNNERGGAFILTLILIVIIAAFVSVLFNQTMTTSKQVHKTGGQTDARLIAEAGVAYYKGLIIQEMNSQNITEPSDLELPDINKHVLDETHAFEIKDAAKTLDGSRIIISFTSVGTAGELHKEIHKQIILEK